MSEYILSCCSTADLSKEYFESRNIHYICFHYMLGDKSWARACRSMSSTPVWQPVK